MRLAKWIFLVAGGFGPLPFIQAGERETCEAARGFGRLGFRSYDVSQCA